MADPHSAEKADMAVRHPKRGKAHRIAPDWRRWYLAPTTSCGLRANLYAESIPVEQIAPEDRCKACFREAKGPRHA